jgi:protein-arginine kinase
MGRGSQPIGCLFQLHNRLTLGGDETAILNQVENFGKILQRQEILAREELWKKFPNQVRDRSFQAMAHIRSANQIDLENALSLLAQLRLGSFYELFPQEVIARLDRLFMEVQPMQLQVQHGSWVSDVKKDMLRAKKMRTTLCQ